jgi:hypothetical protein
MPRKVKVVNINENYTYGDVAEAIVENEKAENEAPEETESPEAEPEPPKPKARARRIQKPKAVVGDAVIEPEPAPEQVAPKPRAKRAPKAKVAELPPVVEEPVEKPKSVRKPRVIKEELHVQKPNSQVPPFPPRLSRTAAREALYHSLASGGLS